MFISIMQLSNIKHYLSLITHSKTINNTAQHIGSKITIPFLFPPASQIILMVVSRGEKPEKLKRYLKSPRPWPTSPLASLPISPYIIDLNRSCNSRHFHLRVFLHLFFLRNPKSFASLPILPLKTKTQICMVWSLFSS